MDDSKKIIQQVREIKKTVKVKKYLDKERLKELFGDFYIENNMLFENLCENLEKDIKIEKEIENLKEQIESFKNEKLLYENDEEYKKIISEIISNKEALMQKMITKLKTCNNF
jgi:hypothetical protein